MDTYGFFFILLPLQSLLTMKVLPQAEVMFMGKVNLATGGVTESSTVPVHAGSSSI